MASRLMLNAQGQQPHLDLPLDIQATAFQWRVWTELQAIPYGETRSYAEIADSLGDRKKARAVANACAVNPVALVVPCHRVVRAMAQLEAIAGAVNASNNYWSRNNKAAQKHSFHKSSSRRYSRKSQVCIFLHYLAVAIAAPISYPIW